MASSAKAVQTFGKKKTATAVAHAKEGRGLIRINGSPINLVQPEILRLKVYEPVLVAGEDAFAPLDIRVRVKGGGHTSQVYAIRQAIAKALVAYYAKYLDAYSALELKKKLVAYDRTLLIADPRRMEPKKFGGAGARARRQKSAAGIQGRPKMARKLKKAGAVICSDPKEANIIVVDASSDAGRQFIRDWGNDTDKVVLQHTWVGACFAASKALNQDDDWGGYTAVDDGLPIANETSGATEDPVKSSLPTPRITPVEAPPPVPVQSTPAPFPETPRGQYIAPQNDISNVQARLYTAEQQNVLLQQQLTQAFMQMQQQQQTFSQGANPMSVFSYPPGPSGPSSPYFAMQQGMGAYGMNQHFPHPNLNAPFPPSSTGVPNQSTDFPSNVPPSVRRKSPVFARSTPTSYTSGDQTRSISPANPSRSASSSSQPVSQTPSRPGVLFSTLFRSSDGEGLAFLVQTDLVNRSETVSAIKKNGGKIATDSRTADYAVLYSQSKQFDILLRAAIAAGTPAVTATFVHDCVAKNELLKTMGYEFQPTKGKSPARGGKRKRVVLEEDDDSTAESANAKRSEQVLRERRDRLKPEDKVSPKKATKAASPSAKSPQLDDPSRPRSPTPPPEHTRQRRGPNHYIYSEQERDYAKIYLKVLLQREHDMSNTAIAKALCKKMDHHSLGSWKTFLTTDPFKTTVEGARKTAGIEFRKQEARADTLAREIEIIAQFYATGGGRQDSNDEDGDDAAWERLTQQVGGQWML
ncbi:hypothetical protein DXG01_000258 [Tephrocybe rancida]|nr:hypothetical protein DXG01_000258 [Tephrocybe rancida]